MSKKNKKTTQQGTYALCITAGTVLGFGLSPMLGDVLIPVILGVIAGCGAGYYFTHKSAQKKH
jgi:hypothetical protein